MLWGEMQSSAMNAFLPVTMSLYTPSSCCLLLQLHCMNVCMMTSSDSCHCFLLHWSP